MNGPMTILFLCALSSQWLFGVDTVELKTGERVQGLFKQATPAGVVMEVAGQSITVPIAEVRAIYLGAAPDAAKAGSSATEAIDALKGLQSVTNSGVSYRDYAPRVLDVKIKVDKYHSGSSESDAAHPAIRLAMHYYELASRAWGARIADDYQDVGEIGRTLRADTDCPEIKTEIAGIRSASDYIIGRHFGFQPAILWSCAASKIAEADKH